MPPGIVGDMPSGPPAGSGGANSEADPPDPGHGCGSNGRCPENRPFGWSIRSVSDSWSAGGWPACGRLGGGWLPGGGGHGMRVSAVGGGGA